MRRMRDGSVAPYYLNGPQVKQLVLINRGKRPLILLAGEVVSAANKTAYRQGPNRPSRRGTAALDVSASSTADGPPARSNSPQLT